MSHRTTRTPATECPGGTFHRTLPALRAAEMGEALVNTGLRRRRTFYYVVRAVDAAGNLSGASNQVRVRTR